MNRPTDAPEPAVDLPQMLSLFYREDQTELLGRFESIEAEAIPEPHRSLLDHHSHMTVAVESHFGSPVDVEIVRSTKDNEWYAREILLRSQADQTIVQYGIVRLRYGLLAPSVWDEIEGGKKPLGRVLIEHEVLRQVELVGLWQVQCGRNLARHFNVAEDTRTFGRTARIFCDEEPAIELLEIVRP